MPAIIELKKAYHVAKRSKLQEELDYYLREYVEEKHLLLMQSLIQNNWEAKIYLKREDLNHTGAHKINND